MDWATFASLATAFGTLVLAIATFLSIRSANRSARVAERALLAGLRPMLGASRFEDPMQKIRFVDGHWVRAQGGHGVAEVAGGVVYLAIPVRNAGSGIAVLDAWYPHPDLPLGATDHAPVRDFRRLTRDLYVAAGDLGFWQGALRDPSEAMYAGVLEAVVERRGFSVDLLYGDHEGGQRAITRFALFPIGDEDWLASVTRHWSLDRTDPRH
ncbi:MAG TPA: hypothetical protein VFO60_04415 [Candidatus Dormibacteraeota bacterium]|nr:hypothetical protein [Candidatus Dormibacteraeota bacterium]